jgi:hypothetical protein
MPVRKCSLELGPTYAAALDVYVFGRFVCWRLLVELGGFMGAPRYAIPPQNSYAHIKSLNLLLRDLYFNTEFRRKLPHTIYIRQRTRAGHPQVENKTTKDLTLPPFQAESRRARSGEQTGDAALTRTRNCCFQNIQYDIAELKMCWMRRDYHHLRHRLIWSPFGRFGASQQVANRLDSAIFRRLLNLILARGPAALF